jgi:hypothetical protein
MRKSICIQFILAIFLALPSAGQNDSISETYAMVDTLTDDFGLFTNDDVMRVTLRFDITEYTRDRSTEEYLKAILTYHINDKDSVNKEIRLKSRGAFRNGFCQFPPIEVNFKKTEFQKEDLSKIQKMKLVTHCMSGNEDYLFREYLAYKLYNVLTDNSFRVRLLELRYINTHKKSKPINTYGFFIEPLAILAERTGCTPVESVTLSQRNMLPEIMNRVAIFNYMIGNTDWSVPNQHNCKILSKPNSERPDLGVIVPYDFDYSGLVDASYAVPFEGLGIKSVRDRLFLGICRNEEDYMNAIKEFSEKKEDFYKVIRDFPYIHERSKKEMINYLDEFYKRFDSRNSIVRDLLNGCKNF